MNEQWIEQMRQKMAGYKRPAPEMSWDIIDEALSANNPHKTPLFWLRRIAVAAIFLLIVGIVYWSLLPNNTEQVTKRYVAENHKDRIENHKGRTENHEDGHNGSSTTKTKVSAPAILAPTILESEAVLPLSTSTPDTIYTPALTTEKQLQPNENKTKPVEHTTPVVYPTDLHQQKHLDNRLTAKVYMSSTMADRQTESFDLRGSHIFEDSVKILQPTYIKQNVHHRQPVRFGFSLRYQFNNRWSVESGLSYTRLSSDITTTEDGVTTMTEQRLNYIGLPLNISYDLWKKRNFGLYVSAGGMIEKSLDTSTWQFSINGAAGAEYKLTDIFSLYTEPGLGCYFKDGSSTLTIYQDHPFSFNLSLGLRFNLK